MSVVSTTSVGSTMPAGSPRSVDDTPPPSSDSSEDYAEIAEGLVSDATHPDAAIGFWIKNLPYVWHTDTREQDPVWRHRRVYVVVPRQTVYYARLPSARPTAAAELWPCLIDPRKAACSKVVRFFGAEMHDPAKHVALRVNGGQFYGTYGWFADDEPLSQRDIAARIYVPVHARCAKGAEYAAVVCVVRPRDVLKTLRSGAIAETTAFWAIPSALRGEGIGLRDFGGGDPRSAVLAFSVALLERADLAVAPAGRFPHVFAERPVSLRFLERVWFLPAGGHDNHATARGFVAAFEARGAGGYTFDVAAIDRVPGERLTRYCELSPAGLRRLFSERGD